MKKRFFKHLILTLMIITNTIALCACSSAPNTTPETATTTATAVTPDLTAISQELLSSNVFGDTLEPIDASYIEMLMKIAPTEYTTAIINMSSGATAERFALFETADNTAALALKDKCDQHIAEQIEAYAGYMPAEVDKLNNSIVAVYDKYVVLCVAESYADAENIIKKYFK